MLQNITKISRLIFENMYFKKDKIIIARIVGGIGNQLFIYSAARRLALMNHAELVLDSYSGFARDLKFKRHYQLDNFNIPCRKATSSERLEPFPILRRFISRRWNQYLPFERRSYLMQERLDYDERLLSYKTTGLVHFEGYWQSEKYFQDIEEIIRLELKITPPTDFANCSMANKIANSKAVAIHVRFFNDPNIEDNKNPIAEYYEQAVQQMERRVPNAHYYLFSDRPDWARSLIPLKDERVTVVDHNLGDEMAFADLWLMTFCNHFIIANSTFSWWGAWLCPQNDKVVITPKFEKCGGDGSWGFNGLIPENWVGIDL